MRKSGFTLVELLVVIGVSAVVGTVVLGFFVSTLTGRAKAQARAHVQEQARFAMERMVYEIRRARGIEVTSDFDVDLSDNASYTLDLDMSTAGRDPTTFAVSAGVLTIKQGSGSAVDLTSNDVEVTNLTFNNRTTANNRSHDITITLTVHKADPSGQGSGDIFYTLQSSVEIRGK
jgi:prepilin-type N-terminal cleavage/methylation domain-containing protein